MGVLESLNDFAACVAVAIDTAPDEYPAWSDGFRGNFAEIMRLWIEIRPQLRRDFEPAHRIDVVLQKMAAAIKAGDTVRFRDTARTLQALNVPTLR